jgi:hypothetical protein
MQMKFLREAALVSFGGSRMNQLLLLTLAAGVDELLVIAGELFGLTYLPLGGSHLAQFGAIAGFVLACNHIWAAITGRH